MLQQPAPPPSIQNTLDRNLAGFLKPGDPQLPDVQRVKRTAQQVFSLGLQSLAQGGALRQTAAPTSWRFPIPARSGLFATVARRPGEAPEFAGLSRGTQAARFVQASEDVAKLPQVADRDYEMRILALPGLLTECFWLKSIPENPGQDLIVPFATAQKELMPMHPYPAADFFQKASKLARERLDAFQQLEDEQAGKALELRELAQKKRAAWRMKGAKARQAL